MYYDFLQRNKRRIVTISSILFVAFFLWVTITLVGRIGKIPVTIAVVPRSATTVVNGQTLSSGVHWLPAGNYTVSARQDGFGSLQKTITVTNDKAKNIISLSLEPQSESAKKWAEKNKQAYADNERFGAMAASADGEYFTMQNPITEKLPFKDPYFTIGYKTEKDSSITITVVTPSPRYRFYAIEKIREWGYEPTEFLIEFQDFKNPLEAK